MARRRPYQEEPDNHERWLVSYADFITLLFAFFVVMYAISSVNEGKYKVLSSAILNAFRPIGNLSVGETPPTGGANTMIQVPKPKPVAQAIKDLKTKEQAKMSGLVTDLNKVLQPLVDGGQVRIAQTEQGVAIQIKDSALFQTGQAAPSTQSTTVLAQVAKVLSTVDNPIRVEGFSDNVPIRTTTYPSNWELSAARAGSVVRLFQENGIEAQRLVAIGRAENLPIADNTQPEGRAQNRRVAISVLTHKDPVTTRSADEIMAGQ